MEHEEGDNGEPTERVDLTLRLESVRQLYTGLAPSLGTDGIFIEVDPPAAPEAVVAFRITLPDDVVVLEGEGTVLWSRTAEDADGPIGMAVRFTVLSPSTRETIDAVIDAHLAGGGELFDLDAGADGPDVYPTDALMGASSTLGQGRWKRRSDVETAAVASVAAPRSPLFGSAAEANAIDLRFEEVLHGLAPRLDDDEEEESDPRGLELDEAIEQAVSAPAVSETSIEAATPEPAGPQHPVRSDATDTDEVIPTILERWKRELDSGIEDLAHLKASPGGRAVAAAASSVLERLPFDDTQDADLATRPVPPEALSTGRRSPPPPGRPWLWWIVGAAAMALLAVTLILLWPQRRPPVTMPVPTAIAQARDEAPIGDEVQAPTAVPPSSAATASPTAVAAAEVAAGRSVVRSISSRARPGATEVSIEASGSLDGGRVDTLALDDPPRILIRVKGIDKPYTPHLMEVGSPELIAIRIGHHPELHPPTLYVVLDTTSNAISVLGRDVEGSTARIVVGRPGGG